MYFLVLLLHGNHPYTKTAPKPPSQHIRVRIHVYVIQAHPRRSEKYLNILGSLSGRNLVNSLRNRTRFLISLFVCLEKLCGVDVSYHTIRPTLCTPDTEKWNLIAEIKVGETPPRYLMILICSGNCSTRIRYRRSSVLV